MMEGRSGKSRSPRRKRFLPARKIDMGSFLTSLHRCGCAAILIKIVYYVLIVNPVGIDELVDSLEVFSGMAMYTQVAGGRPTSHLFRLEATRRCRSFTSQHPPQ